MRFRDLEEGTTVEWLSEDNLSPLTEWYLSVRDMALNVRKNFWQEHGSTVRQVIGSLANISNVSKDVELLR